MSKSTIKLPDDVLARVALVAERAGMTPEQFVLDAIVEKMDVDERAAELDAEAEARYAEILRTGETISFQDMQDYLQRLVQEELAPLRKRKSGPAT